MILQFLAYNFKDFSKRLNYSDNQAWFFSAGSLAMAFGFNIASILFYLISTHYVDIYIENPGYVIVGIPWLITFLILFFNKSLKKKTLKQKFEPIKPFWRIMFWVYYALTILIYAYAMSYYSQVT